jgi:hypothetical protein
VTNVINLLPRNKTASLLFRSVVASTVVFALYWGFGVMLVIVLMDEPIITYTPIGAAYLLGVLLSSIAGYLMGRIYSHISVNTKSIIRGVLLSSFAGIVIFGTRIIPSLDVISTLQVSIEGRLIIRMFLSEAFSICLSLVISKVVTLLRRRVEH